MYTYIHIYIYTYTHIYIYTYIHIYIYTYIHIYIYTYIHIYIYTYIHIYIYTYTHRAWEICLLERLARLQNPRNYLLSLLQADRCFVFGTRAKARFTRFASPFTSSSRMHPVLSITRPKETM